MKLPVLVQPPSGGRISGGFLYNACMGDAGLWEVWNLPPDDLAQLGDRVSRDRLLILDSIWLTPEHSSHFLALRGRGQRVGLMLHSFPSMIEAAETHHALVTRPSAFELEAIAELDIVIVPGRHYRDLLAGTSTPIVVAEPGIDDSWRAEPRMRRGPCRLVSVGAVTPRKGFLDVLEALEARNTDDFSWSVIGSLTVDPAYAARVTERAARLPWVTLHGQLSPEGTRRIVQSSDLLLMPSYDENQPLVLLESIAASVPAIAYAAGATAHMIEHRSHGLIVPIGDKHGFAHNLYRLLEDEPLRQRMATHCWTRQRSLLSWQAAASQATSKVAKTLAL